MDGSGKSEGDGEMGPKELINRARSGSDGGAPRLVQAVCIRMA